MEYLLPRIEYDYLGYVLPQKSRSNIVLDGHMPVRNDKPVFRTIFSMKLLIRQMTIILSPKRLSILSSLIGQYGESRGIQL
jgi:hypothetical protein